VLMNVRQRRVALAIIAAIAAGSFVIWRRWGYPDKSSDLVQVWIAARAWLHGQNPYAAVRTWGGWPYPLLYPFSAVLVIAPLAVAPHWLAEGLFIAVSTALLAWGVTREALISPRLLMFVSPPLLHAIAFVQWSPLLTGAALVPWAGFLLVCKPTIGLALFAGFPRWRTVVGGTALIVLSVMLWPGWIREWRQALSEAPNAIAPVTLWGGPLILLALLKWRRPESRLLAVLACVPHTTLMYEALPLFLVPRTWTEGWILWGGTFLALVGHASGGPYQSQLSWVRAAGMWLVVCAYLPCLVMILRRPNVAPDSIDARAAA
jgi:hypothetical protein